jgi:ABC-type branched-subunit amino acid transport system substrate-binding protein
VKWVNDNGGINGKKIRLVETDYGYKIPEAVAAYKRMVNDERVIMINGWGTGDTEALKDTVTRDHRLALTMPPFIPLARVEVIGLHREPSPQRP